MPECFHAFSGQAMFYYVIGAESFLWGQVSKIVIRVMSRNFFIVTNCIVMLLDVIKSNFLLSL